MTYSYNLLERPWIPCITPEGTVKPCSLRKALADAHRLRGIAGDSPLETAAIYRLMLAVLHSAKRGPKNATEWNTLWQAGTWDQSWLRDYLEKWKHRFDLFDEGRPFFQAADARAKPKSITSLVMDMASGNNASLFDHHTEEMSVKLTPAKAARVLIVAQSFALGGLSGIDQKFTDAPWGRGIIFLIEGENLFQTLGLNLLRYGGDHPEDCPEVGEDVPIWEDDGGDPPRAAPNGYLDHLTWQNRHVLLIPEGEPSDPFVARATIAPWQRSNEGQLDPFKSYRKDPVKGPLVNRFSEDKVLWRDSSALFNVKDTSTHRPPLNFDWVAYLAAEKGYIEHQRTLRFLALGMANDQSKVEFFRQEHLPLPLVYLENNQLVGELDTALGQASEIRKGLWSAVSWMSILIVSPSSDGKNFNDIAKTTKQQAGDLYKHWAIERDFWSALEIPFFRLLKNLPVNPTEAKATWVEILKRTAWTALANASSQAGDGAEALKAAVRARAILGRSLNQLFPDPKMEVSP